VIRQGEPSLVHSVPSHWREQSKQVSSSITIPEGEIYETNLNSRKYVLSKFASAYPLILLRIEAPSSIEFTDDNTDTDVSTDSDRLFSRGEDISLVNSLDDWESA
jgi:hypothetical protein